jgi:uncharacterized delta-60 repeat protein
MILFSKSLGLKFFSLIFLIAVTAFLPVPGFGAAGDVDLSFNPFLSKVPVGTVYRNVIQPDGKIIITGEFNVVNGAARTNIVRVNPDGSIDPTFNPPTIVTGGAGIPIQDIALQTDGKIVIVGQFINIGNTPRRSIARLNADGSPDTAFNSNPGLDGFFTISDLEIAPDGKIYIKGQRAFGPTLVEYFSRINTNGSLDAETQMNIGRFKIQPDGKIVFAQADLLRRMDTNFIADNTFTTVQMGGGVNDIELQPDGKIIIGGSFQTINGSPLIRLARINPNGSVDTNFNVNRAGPNADIQILELYTDGRILASGNFSSFHNVPKQRVVLLNPDSTLDDSFTFGGQSFFQINDLDVQTDGKIIVGGLISGGTPGIQHGQVIRLNSNGSIDLTFQVSIGDFGKSYRTRILPGNKIMASGDFNNVNNTNYKYLVRFNADGSLDTGFLQTKFTLSADAFDVFADGKVVASGDLGIFRFNTDGTQDISYNVCCAHDIKTLPDGRVLIARQFTLERYNTNGTLDIGFNVSLTGGVIYKILLQPDGKILVGGTFQTINSFNRGRIARLNADGTVDASFNPPGGANDAVYDIDLQADGKIVIGGAFTGVNFDTTRKYLARLNADGSLDTSFSPVIDNWIHAVKLQPDGKVLIGGRFDNVGGAPRAKYARLNANGSLDTGFNVGSGANSNVRDIELQSDGSIIMVGEFSVIKGVIRAGIVRLQNAPSVSRTLFDYDGDGRADISVFRPSENRWYIFNSSNSTVTETFFGIAGDRPVPADYDGDGKTDLAIFRNNGAWWYLSSINNQQVTVGWGNSTDIPRPSDFDGDGRADFIVYRPGDATWYRKSSATFGDSNKQFGLPSSADKPVIGDFDGDGKSDVAIYRPSTGDWWWQSSIDNVQRATHWGISTDLPAPADYDGDGKTDFAVYRPSTGTWYVYNSATLTSTILNFGLAEDKPIPADYDGDGKADIAVFRPSTGVWYQMKTTAGFSAQQFGVATDIPTENAFVP